MESCVSLSVWYIFIDVMRNRKLKTEQYAIISRFKDY